MVGKDGLTDGIWPSVTLTEDPPVRCIREVHAAPGPSAARALRSIPRRGCPFAAGASDAPPGAPAPPSDGGTVTALRPDDVAILPFLLSPHVPPGRQ